MGTTISNVTSGVKKQTDTESRELYSLVNFKGGGDLVTIMKSASKQRDLSQVDELLKEKVEPYLYNNGNGKIPLPVNWLLQYYNNICLSVCLSVCLSA